MELSLQAVFRSILATNNTWKELSTPCPWRNAQIDPHKSLSINPSNSYERILQKSYINLSSTIELQK